MKIFIFGKKKKKTPVSFIYLIEQPKIQFESFSLLFGSKFISWRSSWWQMAQGKSLPLGSLDWIQFDDFHFVSNIRFEANSEVYFICLSLEQVEWTIDQNFLSDDDQILLLIWQEYGLR